jgi:hypothetical protein
MPLADYAKDYIAQALEQTPADVAADVYVVSLFVYDEEDDPRLPTVTVGFNTEAQVANTTDDASDADEARWNDAYEDEEGDGGGITERFVELIVGIAQQLHAEGTITRTFGRPIPVLIHELEYYDDIAEQNLRANPGGLADDFARWIEEM